MFLSVSEITIRPRTVPTPTRKQLGNHDLPCFSICSDRCALLLQEFCPARRANTSRHASSTISGIVARPSVLNSCNGPYPGQPFSSEPHLGTGGELVEYSMKSSGLFQRGRPKFVQNLWVALMQFWPVDPGFKRLYRQTPVAGRDARTWACVPHSGKPAGANNVFSFDGLVAGEKRRERSWAKAILVRAALR